MTTFRARPIRAGENAGAVIGLAALVAVAAGFFAPALVALFGVAGVGDSAGNGGFAGSAVRLSRILSALRFTLAEAALSTLVAVAVGFPAAFFVARRDFPLRRFLLALSAVPLCVPPMIIALAFVLYYGRQGWVNRLLMGAFGLKDPPLTFLYSMAGVVFAHGLYNFPVVMRTVSRVWERLPADQEEAASLLGAGPLRSFATVTLPRLARPAISGAALVFLYCFFSFVIVLLFGGVGGTTLEVELYQAARTRLDFRGASIIAAAETLAAVAIIAFYARLQRGFGAGTDSRDVARARKPIRGFGEGLAAAIFLGSILLCFVGPLASIPIRSLATSPTRAAYGNSLSLGFSAWQSFMGRANFLPALGATVSTGLAAAGLSVAAAFGFAFFAYGGAGSPRGFRGNVARLAPLLPLAVSPVMLGFGWNLLSPRSRWAILAIAQASLAWPFAWTQIQGALERVPREILEASRLLSANPLDRFYRTLLPLSARGALSGAALVFAISAGDATLPLILSVPGYENLALLLFRLAGSYRFSEACACAVTLTLVAGLAFFIQDGDRRGR